MSVIKATYTTMGQSSRASLGNGNYYRYNGDKPDPEAAPPVLHPANATRNAGRAARTAEYARLRLEEHLEPPQAAERIGICHSTMQTYDREFKGSLDEIAAQSPEQAALVAEFKQKQQRGESRDG